jgi:predicted P-loop ATPase
MTKQEAAIKYITENYLDYRRLRHDIVADKLQVRVAHNLGEEAKGDEASRQEYWREMTKHDINSIVCHAAQEYDANITSREVMTALQSDLIPDVHPLREYVLSCGEWTEEQPDWIDWVAQQVTVKPLGDEAKGDKARGERLWRGCFKKWFVAMVASWMKDEVVNHQVLVLIGKQGIFKTTWLEHLIPPHLRAYACKLANSNDLNKDERLRIAEFGLISLDEIDSMNNRELNQLKSVITATDVNERAAYAYTKERRVRLASFCASGNRRDFLTDITGNRRWLPFEVESIQNPFYTLLPYERMYAQAWALAQDPLFSYWFDLDEIEVLEEHNQHFRDESNEEQLLPILFDVPAEGKGEFMTTAQISERLVTYGNIKKPMALSRLGMVLGAAGYQSTRPKIGGRLIRGWLVYQRDTDEIASLKRLLKE